MEYTENMHKVGDWVHTENGVGIVTNVFPVYQQYWDEKQELKEREEGLFSDDPETEDEIFGKVPKTGEWIKDIITIKRLTNHDLKPYSKVMCFTTEAYANDKITKKEMREVTKILKDQKIKQRFEKYECKYYDVSSAWKTLIPPRKVVEIKKTLDELKGNNESSLKMTMREIEAYFKNKFNVDIFNHVYYNNAAILTGALLENDPDFYNKEREQVFCKLSIYKQEHNEEDLEQYINNKNIDASYYDKKIWAKHGWDGEDCGF